ncbi:unnamed protein product [Somion occarium]|uniref:acylphosphatase n=1 Tax=Somion occarium TaxID=3059160 RepID=A0ABP1DXV0_9APHY
MALRSFHYVVSGIVQGVGFRMFLRRKADAHGIVGWTQNDAFGNVVGVAQGQEDALAKFKGYLCNGPSRARVTDVRFTEDKVIPKLEFDRFDIRLA